MAFMDWVHVVAIVLGALLLIVAIVAVVSRMVRNGSVTMPGRMFFVRIGLAIVFALLGVIGAFVPIMQGWIFMLLAVLMLFPRSRFTAKVMEKAEPKLPRLCGWLRRLGIGDAPAAAPKS